jgi:hypothetical protein
MSTMILLIAFLAGCATATSTREEIAINRFFDDRVSAETDAVLITYIEKHRALALDSLAKATNANVRHRLALHIMQTTPNSIDEMRTIISERRRCDRLQTRLQEAKENIHEMVRTLSIAGCSKYMNIE